MKLRFDYPQGEWNVIQFNGTIVEWSLTDEIPITFNGWHLMRHVAASDVKSWEFRITVQGNGPVLFNCSSTYFDESKELINFIKHFPEWTTSTAIQTIVNYWSF